MTNFRTKMSELLNDLKQDEPNKKAKQGNGDPFLQYGHSFGSFLKLNDRLVKVFGVLALFACLQMVVFRSFGGVVNFKGFAWTANWSFGSLGFAQNLCSKAMLDWNESTITMNFKCEAHTQITEVLSSGIVSYSSADDY